MNSKSTKAILIIAIAVCLLSFDLPKGWFKAGSAPDKYEMGIDKRAGQDGNNAATIKSIAKEIKGFGTLMQTITPANYIGKRIRMSGMLKSKDVTNYAGLWLRIDGADSKQPIAFDNMSDRPVKGTTDWKKYEIVLDVPAEASKIAFGALLNGTGQIWFDSIKFEIVDKTIPTTGKPIDQIKQRPQPETPVNLDFEE